MLDIKFPMAKCPLVLRPHPGLGSLALPKYLLSAYFNPVPASQHKISAYPLTHIHTHSRVYSLNYRCDTQAIHPIHWTISIAEKACLSASSIRPVVPHQAACLCVALARQLELKLKLVQEPGQGGLGSGSFGAITLHTRQQ